MKRLCLALLALAPAGCAEGEPGVYAVAPDEAFERISSADMDAFRRARQCGILIHFAKEAVAGESVTWRVSSGGRDVARFTARLAPVDPEHTRVAIEIPADPKGGEIYDGSKFYPRPALHQPLRPAVEELIAAALEQRAFDVSRTPNSPDDDVCNIQRAGLEAGHRFAVDDIPGQDTPGSERIRAAQEADEGEYGAPTDDTGGDW